MHFSYTILYVEDVPKTLSHYEAAFGCKLRFLHESRLYGELETGETILSFASYEMAESNDVSMHSVSKDTPSGPANITFTTDNVNEAYATALHNGAVHAMQPTTKPWGADFMLRSRHQWSPC